MNMRIVVAQTPMARALKAGTVGTPTNTIYLDVILELITLIRHQPLTPTILLVLVLGSSCQRRPVYCWL